MEPILIISNLMLVGLTGTYAWLTSKNLKQLQRESEYYRSVVEKQLKKSALPHLYWDLRADSQSPNLRAAEQSNHGGTSRPSGVSTRSQSEQLQDELTGGARNSLSDTAADVAQSQVRSQIQSQLASRQKAPSNLSLEVFNISNVPAYDVHVSLIGAYTEEALGIATFMRSYVQPRHRKYPLQSDKVGYYGVRNAVRLSLLPTQQKIVLSLPFPIQPADVYTLVQYRELSGENYYQVCCFSAIDESGVYRANILEPAEIQTIERLHFFDVEDFSLPQSSSHSSGATTTSATTAENLSDAYPYYLTDFVDLWNHSISSRLILEAPTLPEENVPVKATYDF